jgi:predicted transposase YbfD/YdcC
MQSLQNVFTNFFSGMDDPRSWKNQTHNFITLIGTTFCAVLSGVDSFSGIADFVEMHFAELSQYFDLSGGIPSHDTYQRFWNAISPSQFRDHFVEFIESLKKVCSEVISLDGKTIRNSGKDKPLHIVSAWCQNNQMVFAQEKVHEKSNEITAIPELLKKLDLTGKIITIDAMGAQRDICQQIIEGGGDYVISLKGNQGTLHEDAKLFLEDEDNCQLKHEENDKGHGRIEQRVAVASHDIDWLQEMHKWPGLKAIGKVTATVLKKGKETTETRYYISSLSLEARQLNNIARKHWGIENQLHWRLDVIFNEDKACIRNDNAAENMDIARKWALAILVQAKDKKDRSIKSLMRRNAMSLSHLIGCVKKISHA